MRWQNIRPESTKWLNFAPIHFANLLSNSLLRGVPFFWGASCHTSKVKKLPNIQCDREFSLANRCAVVTSVGFCTKN
ncbi:hypothetical protein F153LOC_17295 [Lelliottia sp. F153]|nr:hypothetical protein F159LOC_03375 [Lelliottia sp. F159]PLY51138.1 hypothetical protein F154LOC_05980 [Lelliottia sp. F154]PLY53600.1 hypothetical protein F153LOC_17295 [Lelliottia sp. F153]